MSLNSCKKVINCSLFYSVRWEPTLTPFVGLSSLISIETRFSDGIPHFSSLVIYGSNGTLINSGESLQLLPLELVEINRVNLHGGFLTMVFFWYQLHCFFFQAFPISFDNSTPGHFSEKNGDFLIGGYFIANLWCCCVKLVSNLLISFDDEHKF